MGTVTRARCAARSVTAGPCTRRPPVARVVEGNAMADWDDLRVVRGEGGSCGSRSSADVSMDRAEEGGLPMVCWLLDDLY